MTAETDVIGHQIFEGDKFGAVFGTGLFFFRAKRVEYSHKRHIVTTRSGLVFDLESSALLDWNGNGYSPNPGGRLVGNAVADDGPESRSGAIQWAVGEESRKPKRKS